MSSRWRKIAKKSTALPFEKVTGTLPAGSARILAVTWEIRS